MFIFPRTISVKIGMGVEHIALGLIAVTCEHYRTDTTMTYLELH